MALISSADYARHAAFAEPDPVLALVANTREAWVRLGEVLKETEQRDRVMAAECAIDAAKAELLETPLTTLTGARAAIAWLVEYDEPNVPKNERRIHADTDPLADLRPRGGALMNAATDRRTV